MSGERNREGMITIRNEKTGDLVDFPSDRVLKVPAAGYSGDYITARPSDRLSGKRARPGSGERRDNNWIPTHVEFRMTGLTNKDKVLLSRMEEKWEQISRLQIEYTNQINGGRVTGSTIKNLNLKIARIKEIKDEIILILDAKKVGQRDIASWGSELSDLLKKVV
jgi:hypothetical protein